MARSVGLREGCDRGRGASRGHMAAVQPGRLWERTQIDLRAPSHGPNGGVLQEIQKFNLTPANRRRELADADNPTIAPAAPAECGSCGIRDS